MMLGQYSIEFSERDRLANTLLDAETLSEAVNKAKRFAGVALSGIVSVIRWDMSRRHPSQQWLVGEEGLNPLHPEHPTIQ